MIIVLDKGLFIPYLRDRGREKNPTTVFPISLAMKYN